MGKVEFQAAARAHEWAAARQRAQRGAKCLWNLRARGLGTRALRLELFLSLLGMRALGLDPCPERRPSPCACWACSPLEHIRSPIQARYTGSH